MAKSAWLLKAIKAEADEAKAAGAMASFLEEHLRGVGDPLGFQRNVHSLETANVEACF